MKLYEVYQGSRPDEVLFTFEADGLNSEPVNISEPFQVPNAIPTYSKRARDLFIRDYPQELAVKTSNPKPALLRCIGHWGGAIREASL